MKRMIIVITVLALLAMGALWGLGYYSAQQDPPVLTGSQLSPCATVENCVCSEYDGVSNVAPIAFSGNPTSAWKSFQGILAAKGATLIEVTDTELRATFKTGVFGFVDDVQARLDTKGKQIHVRSASRVGKKDLGANRKRIEAIRRAFQP